MPDNFSLIILGASILVLFGLFFYYMNRQIQNLNTANTTLTNHVLFQQKIIEKHEQMLSAQGLSSFPSINPTELGPSLTQPNPATPRMGNSSPPMTAGPSVANPLGSVPLAPMVGSLLNIFNQMQNFDDAPLQPEDDDEEEDEVVPPQISKEELDKELSQELEELKPTIPMKKEGRVDKEEKSGPTEEAGSEN